MTPSSTPVVECRSLVKRFGRATALDDLDLIVEPGQVHGFLGPNGAGKSTTIRILLGLVRPNGGRVRVFDADPWTDRSVNARIAYVPGDVALWPNLTGGEIIDLLGSLRGGVDPDSRARLVRDFDLDTGKRARTYSKGNRQKVALIAAFARHADLYILDEPTSGLDPVMEAVFRSEIERVRSEGATVLLSSHVLSEVESLCEQVTIIRDGRTVETSTLADLRGRAATSFRVVGVDPMLLEPVVGISNLALADGSLTFDVTPDAMAATLDVLAKSGARSVTAAPPTLESMFLKHYTTDPA